MLKVGKLFTVELLLFSILFFQHPLTRANSTEGTIGWGYIDSTAGGGIIYTSSPAAACASYRILGFTDRLVGITPLAHSRWDGTSYLCQIEETATRVVIPWLTFLKCASGYVPRWPGVCRARKSSLPPPSCSINDGGFTQGNPVTIIGGRKVQDELDVDGGVHGLLKVTRQYQSDRNALFSGLGSPGWAFHFERQFEINGSFVEIRAGDGTSSHFNVARDDITDTATDGSTLIRKDGIWYYRSPRNTLEVYGVVAGQTRVLLVQSASGQGVSYGYDSDGLLIRLTDTFGREQHLEWLNGRISRIRGFQGEIDYLTQEFETEDGIKIEKFARLIQVTRTVEGTVVSQRRYHYAGDDFANWQLLGGYSDLDNQRFATYEYDTEGRVRTSMTAGGLQRFEFQYDDTKTTVTDPLGAKRIYNIEAIAGQPRIVSVNQPGGSGCVPAANKLTYLPSARMASYTDFIGNTTCFAYDEKRGLRVQRLEGVTSGMSCPKRLAQAQPTQRLYSTQWHPKWFFPTREAAPLLTTTYIYNGQPLPQSGVADCADGGTLADGSPIVVLCRKVEQPTTDSNGTAGYSAELSGGAREIHFTYNKIGQLLSETKYGRQDGQLETIKLSYYEDATADHRFGDLRSIKDPAGHQRDIIAYNVAGWPTKVRGANGVLIGLRYGLLDQIVEVDESTEHGQQMLRAMEYDQLGQLKSISLANGAAIRYQYDLGRRLVQVSELNGSAVQYSLDPMGNRLSEVVTDKSGNVIRTFHRKFDILGRMESSTRGALHE